MVVYIGSRCKTPMWRPASQTRGAVQDIAGVMPGERIILPSIAAPSMQSTAPIRLHAPNGAPRRSDPPFPGFPPPSSPPHTSIRRDRPAHGPGSEACLTRMGLGFSLTRTLRAEAEGLAGAGGGRLGAGGCRQPCPPRLRRSLATVAAAFERPGRPFAGRFFGVEGRASSAPDHEWIRARIYFFEAIKNLPFRALLGFAVFRVRGFGLSVLGAGRAPLTSTPPSGFCARGARAGQLVAWGICGFVRMVLALRGRGVEPWPQVCEVCSHVAYANIPCATEDASMSVCCKGVQEKELPLRLCYCLD